MKSRQRPQTTARCPDCETNVHVRKDGCLSVHKRGPFGHRYDCEGSGKKPGAPQGRKVESRPRIRATWTVEYDADPKHYPGATTPEEMAETDARNGPELFLLWGTQADEESLKDHNVVSDMKVEVVS